MFLLLPRRSSVWAFRRWPPSGWPIGSFASAVESDLTHATAGEPTVSRNALLGFLYLLLALNASPTFVAEAVRGRGWLGAALNLFDISAIVWLALAAALTLCWREPDQTPASPLDWAVAAGAACAAVIPVAPLSSAMLTVVGLWGLASSPARSPGRRAAAIALSLATFFFWGRVFLALGAGPLLAADAQFVAAISGLQSNGNSVYFPDGGYFLIAPGCSSLHGISLALILWTTVISWFDLVITARLCVVLALAVAASVLVNGIRLAMIGLNPDQFDYWHVGGGGMIFGWIALLALAGVIYFGTKDALNAV